MIKFRVARITDKTPEERYAYFIDDTCDCKAYLKKHYDIDIEEAHYGQWFVCTCDAQWTCKPDAFARYYRIIDAEFVYSVSDCATDFNGETPTCAGMVAGECKCAKENTARISHRSLPTSIDINCSEEFGFSMNVVFKD